jgi:hypothetical protein
VIGVLVYAAVRHEANLEAAVRSRSETTRGEAVYPALPRLPAAARARPARAGAGTAAAATRRPPPSQASVELDLLLRRISADTSVLELSYRTFADPCVARNDPSSIGLGSALDRDWLASLKTARLISGVTLREHGATVDCAAARRSLVARAEVLKSDLAAAETLAHASGVRPEHWHDLMAMHQLDVWDRY